MPSRLCFEMAFLSYTVYMSVLCDTDRNFVPMLSNLIDKEYERCMQKQRIKSIAKSAVQFVLNPRFLLCFGIAWLITNGWSYIFLGIGTYYGIGWMIAAGGGYLTFLWFPFTPEKLVTVLIAMWLLKLLFPNDEKTLGVLKRLYEKYRIKRKSRNKNQE